MLGNWKDLQELARLDLFSVIRPPSKDTAYRGWENANYLSYPGLAFQRVSVFSRCGDALAVYAQLSKAAEVVVIFFRVASVIAMRVRSRPIFNYFETSPVIRRACYQLIWI